MNARGETPRRVSASVVILPSGFPIGGITAYQSLACEYWYAPAGRETVAEFYFQQNERLPQYLTESVLRRRVSELDPVTALFGWSAARAWQDGDGVRVTALQGAGGGAVRSRPTTLPGATAPVRRCASRPA